MQIASMSGRSSRSTLTHTNSLVHERRDVRVLEGLVRHDVAPVAGRVADRDEQRAVLPRARDSASSPHGYQSTGLSLCCSRYGELSPPRRFGTASGYPERTRAIRCATAPSRGGISLPAHRESIIAPGAPEAVGPYVHAVRADGLLFCSGQIPLDPKTGELVGATAADQAGRCLENLAAVCEAAGATLGDAVELTVYLTDMGVVRLGQRGVRVVLRVRSAGARGDRRGGAPARRAGGDRRGGGAP